MNVQMEKDPPHFSHESQTQCISRGHLSLVPDIAEPEAPRERPARYLADDGSTFGPDLAPGVPDIRLTEAELRIVWFRDTTALVDVEMPPIEARLLQELRYRAGTGIGDRGRVMQRTPTVLRAVYKTVGDSDDERRMHVEYTKGLLTYLGLGTTAVRNCTIMRHDQTQQARDAIMKRFGGLRRLDISS